MTIKELLKKYNALTDEIKKTDYHIGALNCDIDTLLFRVPALKGKSQSEIVRYLVETYEKCNMVNPEYDYKTDEEMTRMGLRTDKFTGGHNHNIWANGLFHDDGFGLGTEITSIYDDYVDSLNGSCR